MKRIFVLMACLLVGALLFGCTIQPTVPVLNGRKPWEFSEYSKTNKEKIEFTAKRNSYSGIVPTVTADGSLTFSIAQNDATTSLVTSLQLQYNENSIHNGKSNTVDSSVVFSSVDLKPISSERTLLQEAASPERGYTVTTSYTDKTSKVSSLDGEEMEFSLKGSDYYDNEQLYHVLRTIPSLNEGTTYTFDILTPYDMYNTGKFFTHKINAFVSGIQQLEVPKTIFDMAIARSGEDSGKMNDGGKYYLDCKEIKISLASDKSGPPIYIYLADLVFIDNEIIRADESKHAVTFTKNVPIRIFVPEYNISNQMIYSNEYDIKTYSTL